MKKLKRYICTEISHQPAMEPDNNEGPWVKYDDAMQAVNDRQDALDAMTRERNRLLLAVEVGDRMRAFIANYLLWADFYSQTTGAAELPPAMSAEEGKTVAALWDDTRKPTLGLELTAARKPLKRATVAEDIADAAKTHAESLKRLADR